MGKRVLISVKNQLGRTLFESLLVLILVGIFLAVAADRYYFNVKPVRETALTVELNNLRNAVNYYVILNGRLPGSLKELFPETAETKSEIEGEKYRIVALGKFTDSMTRDAEGYPADPFGNRFAYDRDTGRVSSATKGYEKW